MRRQSEFIDLICQDCAEVCEQCAEECARHEQGHCQQCADACRKCAEECLRMGTSPVAMAGELAL
ncbi:MAG TPA: four-helix bundle copper-binding protein [Methylophilaceae bacterium]|nr:four-helix bundle copper-binding protein [Methylophilaceae bacterium]